jgi:hypothetical protein
MSASVPIPAIITTSTTNEINDHIINKSYLGCEVIDIDDTTRSETYHYAPIPECPITTIKPSTSPGIESICLENSLKRNIIDKLVVLDDETKKKLGFDTQGFQDIRNTSVIKNQLSNQLDAQLNDYCKEKNENISAKQSDVKVYACEFKFINGLNQLNACDINNLQDIAVSVQDEYNAFMIKSSFWKRNKIFIIICIILVLMLLVFVIYYSCILR